MGLLYLGQCYENGIGVSRCLVTAANLYRQAAAAGNQQAKGLLTALCNREGKCPNASLTHSLSHTHTHTHPHNLVVKMQVIAVFPHTVIMEVMKCNPVL